MFNFFKKIFSKKYIFNQMLSDPDIQSCIDFKYTIYKDIFEIIKINLYYRSCDEKYILSVTKSDPLDKKDNSINVIKEEYSNFIDASNSFHDLYKKYYNYLKYNK